MMPAKERLARGLNSMTPPPSSDEIIRMLSPPRKDPQSLQTCAIYSLPRKESRQKMRAETLPDSPLLTVAWLLSNLASIKQQRKRSPVHDRKHPNSRYLAAT